MSSLPTETLGDLIEVKHGYAFSSQYFVDRGPYLLLTPGNFYDEGGFKVRDVQKYYDGPVPPQFALKPGNLLVAMTEQGEGLLGSAAFVPHGPTCLHNQRLGLVQARPSAMVDLRYVYYLLNSRQVRQQIRGSATGAKIRHTAPGRIQAVVIPKRSLPDQQRIAAILGAYDELIEVNRRRMALLEGMARGLFEEWFLHFRFPGHEAVAVVETQDRPLPEGWAWRPFASACSLIRGRSYRSVDLADEGGMPFVNLKCLTRDGGFRAGGLKRYTGSFKEKQLVRRGEIVMGVTDMTQERRIVGRVARLPLLEEPTGVISMDLVKVSPHNGIDQNYLYHWLRFSDFGPLAAAFANGANVLHLSPAALADVPTLVPSSEAQARFSAAVSPMIQQLEVIAASESKLASSRDLLLPRLISGQLSVAAAELELAQAA